MDGKKDRLNLAYQYLKSKGVIHTQKDVAIRMSASASNVSSALKGVETVLTEKFLCRFNDAFGNVFSNDWLLTGEGDMLLPIPTISQDVNGDNNTSVAGNGNHVSSTPSSLIDELVAQRKLTEKAQEQLSKAQEQMDRLISVIEKLTAK